jgi:hypothetical protein
MIGIGPFKLILGIGCCGGTLAVIVVGAVAVSRKSSDRYESLEQPQRRRLPLWVFLLVALTCNMN